MARTRKVVFGRINRRQPGGQDTLNMRPFKDDMLDLAESHKTTYTPVTTVGQPIRTWYAADMTVDPSGDFMTGILGHVINEERLQFDRDSWSWVKGPTEQSETASVSTVAPFAIDLRETQRWVGFAPTTRIHPFSFANHLGNVLSHAVLEAGLIPSDWECDLVVSRETVHRWIQQHPRLSTIKRTIKLTNPGRDLDDDRAEMQALAARRKTEELAAYPNRDLRTDTPEFEAKISGLDTGDLEIVLRARGDAGSTPIFNSRQAADETRVDDFENDLQRGMELVLGALLDYVRSRSATSRAESDV